MEKQRLFKNTVIGVLLAVVLCLSIAFAAFSQTLNINGTVNTASATSSWNVKFTSVDALGTSGYATGTASTITGNAESITFTCNVSAPGDTCTLNGTIENLGTIKAKYKGVTLTVSGGAGTTSGTTYTDNDISVVLTPPALWTADNTILASTDSGNFSMVVSVFESATLATETTYTITATFSFAQAENA